MSLLRKSGYTLVGLGVVIVISVYWLVATNAGVRWLLAQTRDALPAELTLGAVNGTLIGGLELAGLRWSAPELNVAAEDVFVKARFLPLLRGQLDITTFSVASLTVTTESSDTETTASPDWPTVELPITITMQQAVLNDIAITTDGETRLIERIALGARASGSDFDLKSLTLASNWLRMTAHAKVQLKGTYPATAEIEWLLPDAVQTAAGRLRIRGDRRRYAIEHTLSEPFTIHSTGQVVVTDGSVGIDLAHTWQSLDGRVDTYQVTSAAGTLTTKGTLANLALELSAAQIVVDEFLPVDVTINGSTDLAKLDLEMARVDSAAGALSASGIVRWQPGFEFELELDGRNLDAAYVDPSLTGLLEAKARVSGQQRDAELLASVNIRQLSGTLNGASVSGSLQSQIAGDVVRIDDALVNLGTNTLSASGVIDDELDLQLNIDLNDLRQISETVTGLVSGTLHVRGTRDEPQLRADLLARKLRYAETEVGTANINGNFGNSADDELRIRANDVRIAGQQLSSANVTVSGLLAAHTLAIDVQTEAGSATAQIRGGLADQNWRGEARELVLKSDDYGRWDLTTAAKIAAGENGIQADEMCLRQAQGSGQVCLAADIDKDRNGEAVLDVRSLPVAALLGLTTLKPDGLLSVSVTATADNGEVSADGNFDVADARLSSQLNGVDEQIDFERLGGTLTLADGALALALDLAISEFGGVGTVRLGVADLNDDDPAISGDVALELKRFDLLALLVPGINQPEGRLSANVQLSGRVSVPRWSGRVELRDGAFGVRQAGIEISAAELIIDKPDDAQLSITGNAKSGEGTLQLLGRAELSDLTKPSAEITLRGQQFELIRLPEWQVVASPDLQLALDSTSAIVTGSLGIPKAEIRLNEIPASANTASPDAVVHRSDAPAKEQQRRYEIDVTTVLGDQVAFSGFGLETRLTGKLAVSAASDEAATGQGRLSLIDGRYEAYGQELEIERGDLNFDGPLDNPRLDIRAVRQIDAVTAGVNVTGTPTRLRSDLFSEPALSDAEALSYLITGRPLAGASASDGALLNNAAFALGLSRAGSIVSELQSTFGLDTLTIEGGAENGKIVAGKRIGSRLLVEYGYGLIDRLGTLLLRYELNDRLYLESRTGEVSNLDVVYRVRKD